MIEKYLTATYKDGARGEGGRYDCWGLVRAARVELCNKKLLASRGGEYRFNPIGFTEQYNKQVDEMIEIEEPVAGAFIAVIRKKYICEHVALVLDDVNKTGFGLHVLEINPDQNARMIPLFRFLEFYRQRTIKYYDDKNLP